MKLGNVHFNPFLLANFIVVATLMAFMPLSRGGVHMWQQTIMAIAVQIGFLILLIEFKLTGLPEFKRTRLFLPISFMFCWMLLSASFSQVKAVSFEALFEAFIYAGYYFLLINLIRQRKHRLNLVYFILSVSVFLSMLGYLQLAGITFPWWQYGGAGVQAKFMTASYVNHNHLAGYLEMSLPLVIALVFTLRGFLGKFLAIIGAPMLLSAHLLTLSRGGWGAMLFALSFFLIVLFMIRGFRKKKSLLIVMVVLGFSILVGLLGSNVVERVFTLTEEDAFTSYQGRNIAWSGTLEMIGDYPLLGVGPGNYADIFTQYQPPGMNTRFYYAHNDYLQYIAELGMPVVAFMVWILTLIFAEGVKKLKSRSRQTWGITLGALTGIVAILFHSLVDFNLHIPANTLLFITLAALVMADIKPAPKKENTR